MGLIKSSLILIPVNLCDSEPTIIQKLTENGSVIFGDVHILDDKKIPAGATFLNSFLKTYNTKETARFPPGVAQFSGGSKQ